MRIILRVKKSDHKQKYRQIEQTKTTRAKPWAKQKKNKNKANLTKLPQEAQEQLKIAD